MRLLCLKGDIKNSKEKNKFYDENFFFLNQLEILTFIKNKNFIYFFIEIKKSKRKGTNISA